MKTVFQPVAAVYDRRPHKQNTFSYLRQAILLLFITTIPSLAAATLNQQIDPPEANIGDAVSVTFSVQNGAIKQKEGLSLFGMHMPNPDITLPQVDGLQTVHLEAQTSSMNGISNQTVTFTVIPAHSGNFNIPAFDIHLQDGSVLRTQPMKLHVLGPGSANNSSTANPQTPVNPPPNASAPPPVNPNGPVIFPPNNGAPPDQQPNNAPPNPPDAATNNPNPNVPTEADGRPAKVFIIITPQTTDAYVGQSIPMRIDFYIRMDSDAQQDSLPTIKGSDFLMNNLATRFREDEVAVMNEAFHRNTWFTAISAPKSGDFPLQMERDTYWVKSLNANQDPFTNFFPSQPNLAHESVPSNQLTMHVHVLPTDGRPANFSGAIGKFDVTGAALPLTVAVGDPVTLHFSVNGQGNFDYVRCPTLADDPAWKTYVPSSKIEYQDESHTEGVKNFEMAIIPQKNGTVPLPQANFSYFDPTSKQYVTTPINLPPITVTGTAATPVATSGTAADSTFAAAPAADGFLPNRIDSGSPQISLIPVYRETWFWVVQGGLLTALVLCAVVMFLRSRSKPEDDLAAQLERQNSLTREEDAMGQAAHSGDALAFFMAARHAVQLKLGTQWRVNPESLTLTEIRQRNPQLAETLEPLFLQADEIIYSGGVGHGLDLAQWERHVRELLQPQTQPA